MENQTLTGISNTEMQQRELDIVIKARQIAQNGESLRSRFNAMLNLYENQPTIRPTDTKSKLFQQYSTPCPLAFLASEYVKQEGENLLFGKNPYYFEPSAGNGMLTISLPEARTCVNELDEVRYKNLKKQGFCRVTKLDSSKHIDLYPGNFFDGVITNPPFKSLEKSEQVEYNNFTLATLDYKMTAVALSHLLPTGKAAVIVGGKLFDNYWKPIKGTDKQMLFGQWKVFLGWLYGQYDVVDVIYIGGDYIYRKQGTTYPVVLILIKGRHAFNKDKYKPRYIFDPGKDKIIETYEQLFARVSPYITDTQTTQPDVHPLFQNEIKIAMEKQNEYQDFQGFNQNTTDNIMDGSNYDNKHINNLAPDKIIPYSVIENISKEGMTLESIDKLTSQGFPVCKYHTQITVHGNCPKLKSEYVGKYKCLTINQNQSLGIRWIGIDDGKKKRLAEIAIKIRNVVESNNPNDYEIHPSNWWYYSKDSQNTTFYTYLGKCEKPSGWIYTPSQRQKEEAHKIVTDLYNKLKGKFFGHVFTIQGNLQSLYLCVNILGIYEKNIPYFIETVFGYNQAQLQKILSDFDRKKADAEKKQKAADEHEEKTKQDAQKQYDEYKEEWISRHPIPSEFVKPQPGEMPQQGDIICYYYLPSINTFWHSEPQAEYVFLKEKFDVNARFAFKTFYKSFGKMCYCNCDINGNKPSEHYKRDSREYGGGFQPNWYVKRASAKTKPTATSTTTAPTVSSADLQIVDYSDKAIVLTGDTKPLKDQIKALGGKFGSRFDTSKVPSGIGWLFPKTKLAQVEDFVKKYSKKSEPKIHQLFRNEIELAKIKNSKLGDTEISPKLVRVDNKDIYEANGEFNYKAYKGRVQQRVRNSYSLLYKQYFKFLKITSNYYILRPLKVVENNYYYNKNFSDIAVDAGTYLRYFVPVDTNQANHPLFKNEIEYAKLCTKRQPIDIRLFLANKPTGIYAVINNGKKKDELGVYIATQAEYPDITSSLVTDPNKNKELFKKVSDFYYRCYPNGIRDVFLYSYKDGTIKASKINRNIIAPYEVVEVGHCDENIWELPMKDPDKYIAFIDKGRELLYNSSFEGKKSTKRIGKDWLNGKEISSGILNDTFKFRSILYGSTKSKDFRELVENAYNAFSDLAYICGHSQERDFISHGGALGVRFGAKSISTTRTRTYAYYKPGDKTLNFTSKDGAGTLAHEWFHSFDYFLASYYGKNDLFPRALSEYNYYPIDCYLYAQKPEFRNLLESWFSTMRGLNLYKTSLENDKRKRKDYWATRREIMARCFEYYCLVKLETNGMKNDFLVEDRRSEKVYPQGEDGAKVIQFFDKFFSLLNIEKGYGYDANVHYLCGDNPEIPEIENTVPDNIIAQIPPTQKGRYNFLMTMLKPYANTEIYNKYFNANIIVNGNSLKEIRKWASLSIKSVISALNLDNVVANAVKVSEDNPHNNTQKRKFKFKKVYIMNCDIKGVGMAKLTIGEQKNGKKITYCITSLSI